MAAPYGWEVGGLELMLKRRAGCFLLYHAVSPTALPLPVITILSDLLGVYVYVGRHEV